MTTLLDIRTSHGRGDFRERWLDKETYVFERGNSALVGLSNRLDGGFTERRVDVDFAWGTTLVELTGNATAFTDIPELVTVDDDFWQGPRRATLRVPHNAGGDQGYVIYGLAPPRSAQGVTFAAGGAPARVIAGGSPEPNDYANGRERPGGRTRAGLILIAAALLCGSGRVRWHPSRCAQRAFAAAWASRARQGTCTGGADSADSSGIVVETLASRTRPCGSRSCSARPRIVAS